MTPTDGAEEVRGQVYNPALYDIQMQFKAAYQCLGWKAFWLLVSSSLPIHRWEGQGFKRSRQC